MIKKNKKSLSTPISTIDTVTIMNNKKPQKPKSLRVA